MAVMLLGLAAPQTLAQADPYTISEDHAECIRANADRYLAEARPVYLISFAGCVSGRDLSDETVASSATPEINIVDGDGDGIVVLTPDQLRCLRDNFPSVAEPLSDMSPVMVALRFESC